MSGEYFKQLDDISKKRYEEKLLLGGHTLPDPLDEAVLKNVFKTDHYVSWPNLSFGDIYMYLVVKKCFYTNECFENYKGLQAYNFLTSGKISAISSFKSDGLNVVMLTCAVQASQTLKKAHQPWVIVETTGKITCAHCTCMAGLGEACSHIAGLLLAVESGLRHGIKNPSCTSEPCKWNKVSKKPVLMPAYKICFSHKRKKKALAHKNQPGKPPKEAFDRFLSVVKREIPNAPIFHMTSDTDSTSSASEGEDEEEQIPTIIDIIQKFNSRIPANLTGKERCEILFQDLCSLQIDAPTIEEKTRIQVRNSLWMRQRKGRLTASLFHRVIHCKTGQMGIMKDILQLTHVETKEMRWGKMMEAKALASFKMYAQEQHDNVIIQSTGLLVDRSYPFLGASVDGRMVCDCHPPAVIEIKCPFSLRNEMIKNSKVKNFFLDKDGNLKNNHPYYNQIQGQMAIWDVELCYFVTYTTVDINVQKIGYDEGY